MKFDLCFPGVTKEQAEHLIQYSKSLNFPESVKAEIVAPAEILRFIGANPQTNTVEETPAPVTPIVNDLGKDTHTEPKPTKKRKEKEPVGHHMNEQGIQCDINNVPYNPEFHVPKLTKKDVWVSRKNIDQAAKAEYEKQFAAVAVPAPAVVIPGATPTPAPAAAPALNIPPAVPVVQEPVAINTFVQLYSKLSQSGILDNAGVQSILAKTQANDVAVFMQDNPDSNAKRTLAYTLLEGLEAQAA